MRKLIAFILGCACGLALTACEAPEATEKANRENRADAFLAECVKAAGSRADFSESLRECERIANSIRKGGSNAP